MPARDRLAWFRWNPGDHHADPAVRAMSREERGAYREVLDALYLSNTASAAEGEIRVWAGYSERQWTHRRDALARAFKIGADGVWLQKRVELELKAARRRTEQAAKGGRITAGKRRTSLAVLTPSGR